MRTKFILNPFLLYIIVFSAALSVFSLKWSKAYLLIGFPLMIFLIITFIISLLLALYTDRDKLFELKKISKDKRNGFFVLIIILGYSLEFIYHGGIPIFQIIFGSGSYHDFLGIPVFHVLLQTFTNFYSIYLFHQYLVSKNKFILLLFLLLFSTNILLVNRGAFTIVSITVFFLFLHSFKRLKGKFLVISVVLMLLFLYFFGVIGNIRTPQAIANKDYILIFAQATNEFRSNNVPDEFYWSYLYIASPIGNLGNLILIKEPDITYRNFNLFVLNCLIPDFIAKRIGPILNIPDTEYRPKYFILHDMNAPSVYYDAYRYFGWFGVSIMFFVFIFTVFAFITVMKKSIYFNTGICMILTITTLNIFNNMWNNSGISFMLVYPFLFSIFFDRLKTRHIVFPKIVLKKR